MKYIIVAEGGSEYAILFDEILTHASVAGNLRVKSAGFCSLTIDSTYITLPDQGGWRGHLRHRGRLSHRQVVEPVAKHGSHDLQIGKHNSR